jgi:hypothetical protein
MEIIGATEQTNKMEITQFGTHDLRILDFPYYKCSVSFYGDVHPCKSTASSSLIF